MLTAQAAAVEVGANNVVNQVSQVTRQK